MRVVVVGDGEGVEDVLLHHSLRNSVDGLYLTLQRRRQHSRANASLSRQRLTPRLPHTSNREDGGEHVSVYRRCLYCGAGREAAQHVGRWRPSDVALDTLFFGKDEQFKSLEGHSFKILSTAYIPYFDFLRDRDEPGTTIKPIFSVELFILEELTKRLNFTYVMREQPDGVWGRLVNSSFNGMMGRLEKEEVDYCTLCGITPNRNKIIDHLPLHPSDPITVVSLKPSFLSQHFLLVRPLTGRVWAGVLAGVVLWGSVMVCFDKLLRRISTRTHLGVNLSFLLGWGSLLEQSSPYLPVSVSKRVLLSAWLTFSLIVVSAYKSSLIANLSIQGKVIAPETLGELVKAKNWEWGTEEFVFKGYPFEYFYKHRDPVVMTVFKGMKVGVP
ncbi:glutamate receptor ionotropic, kainate 2-like [Eriocheir sinensis]|uniref:glutamate receptor ionotropic, kainate 2-like n=1 Tax=Eriocheir sinensis TaxID=95602 RepID=UPI0021C8433D|nr:glutamate receptor ionotropic, kainate 2-like [Eriocheir sinensis]